MEKAEQRIGMRTPSFGALWSAHSLGDKGLAHPHKEG
jgi:hypothetical protein